MLMDANAVFLAQRREEAVVYYSTVSMNDFKLQMQNKDVPTATFSFP
jgi:hypothetical protein